MEENDVMMAKIALFVKEKREDLGMSQSVLALRVFGSKEHRAYISLVENQKKEGLTIKVLSRILKELNSDITFIEY